MTPTQLLTAAAARCDPELVPEELPQVADIADSVALTRAIGTATFTQVSDSVHLSLAFDDDGRLMSVSVVRAGESESVTERVRALVTRHVRGDELNGASGLRMNVGTGPNPSITLFQSSYCEPSLDQSSLRGLRSDVRLADRESVAAAFRNAINYRARVTIDPLGRARAVRLEQITGMPVTNPLITEEIRNWRFLPALVDGIAIDAVIVLNGNRLVSAARWF